MAFMQLVTRSLELSPSVVFFPFNWSSLGKREQSTHILAPINLTIQIPPPQYTSIYEGIWVSFIQFLRLTQCIYIFPWKNWEMKSYVFLQRENLGEIINETR